VIFLVNAGSGYANREQMWPVRAFSNRADAEALVERLTAWCVARGYDCENIDWDLQIQCGGQTPTEDPLFDHTYGGLKYTIEEVPSNDDVDTRKLGY
jgi:hypothetical protein